MSFDKNNKDYQQWSKQEDLDKELKTLLSKYSSGELESAFGIELEFGTAGIRGMLGAGPGRFNIYTIKKVTRSYAKLLKKKYPNQSDWKRGVVIGHDNRHNSAKFAKTVAEILSSEGIKAYLYADNKMQPTPVVSFSTRAMNCIGGVVITASHNPAEYNGYKIYDETGCQLMPEDTDFIAKEMDEIKDILSWTYEVNDKLMEEVPHHIIHEYEKMINNLQFHKHEISKHGLRIIFSAVNGTGTEYTPKILRHQGYDVIEVEEHANEDETFKNVGNPNPEFPPAWQIPLAYAKKHNADLILINDPDADRLGVATLHDGQMVILNGNEVGALLINWKLHQLDLKKKIPTNPTMYSSFVTSDLGDRIAHEQFNVEVVKTLTGFKWMGNEINKEAKLGRNFVFAYEESIGYVIDDSTRDKDGIQAAIMTAEMAWNAKNHDQSLVDVLNDIYDVYGYYFTFTLNLNFSPEEKDSKIKPIMEDLRKNGIGELAGERCVKSEDYIHGLYNMPGQDLLKFYFEDKSWVAIRPSGTEPKLKIYFNIVSTSNTRAVEKGHKFEKELRKMLNI
ncbi:phospho-sugar mutase [Mesoplasma lactucae]|uniref:Phosphomannomutase n=1 Tax=Mesoplasma lactucae ATCC 49193 TaxID=81460 RepID=A0A291IR18_9MOLU|nr:phospho-sugar mutase [Mesoplasma lactucae]ATG97223.1 phosphomannomutase [Mesoplasma lactucae ATCC 49193]ATZ20335.1 phosphoglucomutase/phosphomannomutase [Mesoplasma lactucae ATCC 49193]MCL8216506.1 Phosphoglucomutase [Mesoplasma lactucae ATCC 49193]